MNERRTITPRPRIGLRTFLLLCLAASLLLAAVGLRTIVQRHELAAYAPDWNQRYYSADGSVREVELSDHWVYGQGFLENTPPDNAVTDDDLRRLTSMQQLQRLVVRGEGVSDEGIAHLAELSNLRYLKLEAPNADGHSLRELVKLRQLQSLNVARTKAASADLIPLGQIKSLQRLAIPASADDHTLYELRRQLPECEIWVE